MPAPSITPRTPSAATYGAAVEWYQDWWTIRAGLFDLSAQQNSIPLSLPLFHQDQFVAEAEERHTLWGQPGKLKFLYYLSRANMGTFSDALVLADATHTTPSTLAVASYRSKFGVVLNLEQQLTPDLGMFARPAGPRAAWRHTTSPTSARPCRSACR